ncbi:HdeD family acid-resistance protein [Fructobacillus fructosus]|uniref:HdeD family acid-resistance protein n=1 Tax=Fructobacillus fructosus TaxID=1631 RepID=UPI001658C3F2|nr:DUF308 domain-containing protein [Fructobacillus fructosus]MBC9119364.1 DUF308 domain-containing protein [Fructobacillus fructosus]MBD9366823.1 DUF308 domain-containing protein [Leuconostoc mesenteroides]
MTDFAKKVKQSIIIDGLISLIIGIFIVVWPGITASVAAVMIGVGFISIGSAKFSISVFGEDGNKFRIIEVILSILYIIAGIFIVVDVKYSGVSLLLVASVLTGILWISEGITQITDAIEWKEHRVLYTILAIINIIAGVSLLFSPLFGGLFLWMFFGITLITVGIVKLVQSVAIN